MTVLEILKRLEDEIEYHKTKSKYCAPTEYTVHVTAIGILLRYKDYLLEHQKWMESKCREMVEVLREI